MEPAPEIYSWAPLRGPTWSVVRTRDWTYVESPKITSDRWWGEVVVPPVALYHRSDDPDEFADVADDHPEIVGAMASRLAERQGLNAALRSGLGAGEALAVDTAAALRELGYLDRDPLPAD